MIMEESCVGHTNILPCMRNMRECRSWFLRSPPAGCAGVRPSHSVFACGVARWLEAVVHMAGAIWLLSVFDVPGEGFIACPWAK